MSQKKKWIADDAVTFRPTLRICKQCKYYSKESDNPVESWHYCSIDAGFFNIPSLIISYTVEAGFTFHSNVPHECPYKLEHTINAQDVPAL